MPCYYMGKMDKNVKKKELFDFDKNFFSDEASITPGRLRVKKNPPPES